MPMMPANAATTMIRHLFMHASWTIPAWSWGNGWASARGARRDRGLGELRRELADDAVGEHVGHRQDLVVHLVVVLDAPGVTALQLVHGLAQRQVQVGLHHRAHVRG